MIQLLAENFYVPWDTDLLVRGFNSLRSSIGVAFNVGFWLFLCILGILVVKAIVEHFLG